MLTPEQQDQYQALLLKRYKGTLTTDEQTVLEALEQLQQSPDPTSIAVEEDALPSILLRFVSEAGQVETDLEEMSAKIDGRRAIAEAKADLGHTVEGAVQNQDDVAH
ncbi:MAG: hypothetical protein ACUVR8_08020 [Acidobacteriota bacterium]